MKRTMIIKEVKFPDRDKPGLWQQYQGEIPGEEVLLEFFTNDVREFGGELSLLGSGELEVVFPSKRKYNSFVDALKQRWDIHKQKLRRW